MQLVTRLLTAAPSSSKHKSTWSFWRRQQQFPKRP